MTYRRDKPSRRPWFHRIKSALNPWRNPHRNCGQVTPEQDKQIARRAIAEQDYRHATFHVAGAVFANPNDREALDLADELLHQSSDPLELVPLEDKNFAGTIALRAYFLAESGRLVEGIKLLRQVMAADRDRPFEFWALRWLDRSEALEQIPTVDVVGVLSLVVVRFPGHSVADDPQAMAQLKPWLQIAQRFVERRPNDPSMLAGASLVVRRSGDFQAALRLAEESYRIEPSYIAATARAVVHEAQNNPDAALAAYQDCLRHDPESAEILADMALLELRRGNMQLAQAHTQRGLQSKPDHRTLEPLSFYLSYRLNNDSAAFDKLSAYVKSHPGHVAQSWLGSLRPYIETLPSTAEATLGILDQILPKLRAKTAKSASTAKFTVSAIEAPSSRVAVTRALGHFGMTLETTIEKIATPDPRLPCTNVAHVLWKYNGTEPEPALPAPPETLGQLIAAIASRPYDLWSWAQHASELARQFTPGDIPQLLAVAVHPPAAPAPEREPVWILQVQIVVALAIRRLHPGPLANTPAEQALLSMLFGPMDWTNIAAIVALTHYALEANDAAISDRIARLLLDRLKSTPHPGHCCFTFPALWALCALPKIEPGARETFNAMYKDYLKNS